MTPEVTRYVLDNVASITLLHFKAIKKQINDLFGYVINAQELFDVVYPDRVIGCTDSKFVSWSVGYRACYKGCKCYKARLSGKLKEVHQSYSVEQKVAIKKQRAKTNLERYGVSNTFQQAQDKIKQTKLARYNDASYSNREKAISTITEKYGVENVMQVTEVCARNHHDRDYVSAATKGQQTKLERYSDATFNNREKAESTNLTKYGVPNVMHSPATKEKVASNLSATLNAKYTDIFQERYDITFVDPYKHQQQIAVLCNKCNLTFDSFFVNGLMKKCPTCFPKWVSKDEHELREFLVALGVTFESNDRTLIAPYELDIVVPDCNVAFEYNGLFWHTEDTHPDRNYHYQKTAMCAAHNVKLVQIFSHHWYLRQDIVKSRIRQTLGLTETRIYARQCHVSEITTAVARTFLDKAHLDGYTGARVKLGLYCNDVLVSVMTFGNNRFDSSGWEVIRFASLLNCTIVGAAGKLFKHFTNHYSPAKVTSFSDNTWGYTEFYSKLGFTLESRGKAGYSYVDRFRDVHTVINRMQVQKHKLVKQGYDSDLTEVQIMKVRGFTRLWDCGHSKWVWNNDR